MSSIYEQIAKLPPEKRELFELMLMEQGVDLSQMMILPQPRTTNTFPLSFAQQRLWFLDKLQPGSPMYNIPSVLRLRGTLNIQALERSFNEVIRRHEVLRTTFDEQNGQPVQVIAPELNLPVNIVDLTATPADQRDEELNRRAVEESFVPFNLAQGPMLRVTLLKFAQDDYGLLVTMHHIVSDNWSTAVFVHEIMELYRAFVNNQTPHLPPLNVQYADFAVWQRKWLKGKTLENQLTYWREQLRGIPPIIELPLDKPRPAFQTYHGDFKLFRIPDTTAERLRKLSREQDVTLFMTLLAAYFVLLHRYSAQDDISVGSPIANRNRKETENLIGFFVNTLVLRGNLAGNPTFTELLQRVKESTLGAFAHQDLPFEMLVEELQPERDMSHSPLFQVMFVMNNVPVEKLQLPGLELSVVEIENKTAKFDLILNVTEDGDRLSCKLEYNTDLFLDETMDRFISHYLTLLEQVVDQPQAKIGELRLLTDEERQLVTDVWSKPSARFDDARTVVQLFEQQAEQTPEAVALRVAQETVTFKELNLRANRLAHLLIDKGLTRGQIVGVNADRSAEMIVAFLAVLKAGGVYLPLDPDYPLDRLEYMLNDSRAAFLLTKSSLQDKAPQSNAVKILLDDQVAFAEQPAVNPGLDLKGEDTAYVIYTSGSTGQPKGVAVSHYAIANHCLDMAEYYALTPEDNVLQFAALNFDASIEQILPPLISGATVCMRDNEIWNSQQFAQKIIDFRLTVINPPTAYWAQVIRDYVRHPEWLDGHAVRLVIVGGDVFHPELIEQWQKSPFKNTRLLNAYGPTETVITATTFDVRPNLAGSTVPIGRPRANREVYVVDKYDHPAPIGVPGELLIGGSALAQSYLHRPELTAERFVNNPISGKSGRVYRTGDRVRFLPDGNLEFLGRVDDQVKIRGFRIELGEIEHAIASLPGIKHAAVRMFDAENRDKILVAYYQPEENTERQPADIKEQLRQSLPEYMIPAMLVPLEKMPIGPGGKINRRALPKPDLSKAQVSAEYVAPRTESEEKLVRIVREILNVERVGVFDNFFELGGHSMMATQVVSRIQEEFGVSVPLRALFEHPTVDGIAQVIAELQLEEKPDEELDDLLAELEGLSEEEVEKLLQEESSDSEPNQPEEEPKPINALEAYLLGLWREALGRDDLTIFDNFFAKGGDEQKAQQVLDVLEKDFNHIAPPGVLLYAPTVEKFANFMLDYYHDLVEQKFGKIDRSFQPCLDEKFKKAYQAPVVTETDVKKLRQIIVPFTFDRSTAPEKNKAAVFVLSPPRSGSTLLRVILHGNSRLFAPPEMDLLSFNTMRERREFFQSRGLIAWLDATIRTIMEIYRCDAREAEEIFEAFLAQDISTHEFYRRLQFKLNGRMIVDKTPSYAQDINILQRAEDSFESPLYIHLVRHPYAMIYSFMEAKLDQNFFKYEHPFTRRQLAELIWIISHQNIENFLSNVPDERKFRLRYEDLVRDPKQEVQRLSKFLGVPFEEEMLDPYHGDKMTSGIKQNSQMVGDYKFYLHRGIDPRSIDRWKKFHCQEFLSEQAKQIATQYGFDFD